MNTYKKYYPNVFLAKTAENYNKNDVIEITTKYGKVNRHIIYNLIYSDSGFNYYSIVREDGFNVQKRALKKAEQRKEWAASAETKATKYYEASKEGAEFLALGEPIKVGHHSEARHRNLIERNHKRFGNYIEQSEKEKSHLESVKYFELKAIEINLSMPESLDFFKIELEKAIERHKFLKENPTERVHSMELTYANNKVKELKEKLQIAERLWL